MPAADGAVPFLPTFSAYHGSLIHATANTVTEILSVRVSAFSFLAVVAVMLTEQTHYDVARCKGGSMLGDCSIPCADHRSALGGYSKMMCSKKLLRPRGATSL